MNTSVRKDKKRENFERVRVLQIPLLNTFDKGNPDKQEGEQGNTKNNVKLVRLGPG
eukprot:CAMPEP_0171608716 /NCGR_PEP_ID=MMETSP0990-20121206/9071_1 /TAXON_ID=483369 /ORGANISM="non described non described, Strain CCMP2098" /LENGTH=55 /DNA_ID=CAMNT_0012171891 /DNA_START=539 /DNA_END=706 /DNA_ORIENTATION=+